MSRPTGSDLLDLIRRARADDAIAKNDLMTLVRNRMKGFFDHRVQPMESSDLAQDATINVCTFLDTFQGNTEAQFWRWVHVVARNVAAGMRRHETAQKRRGGKDPLPEDSRGGVRVPGDEPTPSAIVQRREQVAAVGAALAQLSPQDQRIIQLRDDEGKDWPEVARILDKTEEAARKCYRRAIKKWAKICQEVDDAPRQTQ